MTYLKTKHTLVNNIFIVALFLITHIAFAQEKFVVVLDAGHGGKDPGKIHGGVREKDLALDFTLLVGKQLEKIPDVKVIYTRKKDVFVDLYKRGEIANKAKANLFVSIHCNAHNSSASGIETFILGLHANERNFEVAKSENEVIYLEDDYVSKYKNFDINSPESLIGITITQEEFLEQSAMLATLIQHKLTTGNFNRKDRGVKQAGFIVLHQTFMPSVLIETGFITNKEERTFLRSKNGRKHVGNSITNAILEYHKRVQLDIAPSSDIKEEEKSYDSSGYGYSIDEFVFKVQILAARKKIDTNPRNFKGLKPIQAVYGKSINRYYYGNTDTYDKAIKLKNNALKKGYNDAYIIAYKNGNRISVNKAREELNKNN